LISEAPFVIDFTSGALIENGSAKIGLFPFNANFFAHFFRQAQRAGVEEHKIGSLIAF